jgi:hypothetical protein
LWGFACIFRFVRSGDSVELALWAVAAAV